MDEALYCFRCGESLAALTLPISRQDACPACSNYLHICRMCINFDSHVPKQCREDDAEEVMDKEKANFCDWYKPSPNAFNAAGKRADDKARSAAAALFSSEAADAADDDDQTSAAADLFR
jgi:hypothetical protein